MVNKRFKDIYAQYIYKSEPTPLTLGTLAICALCFLTLIVATFTQITFFHPSFILNDTGVSFGLKENAYSPLIPCMIFIIYILGKNYSLLMYIIYLLTGLFIWPIFVFGGGISYLQNYLFGYIVGFGIAIFIQGNILKNNHSCKNRIKAGILGVFTIHITGIIYCIILAIFKVIEFNLIVPIASIISANNIIYDLLFSTFLLFIGPYIKNVFWTCMKPKPDRKKLKNSGKRHQIVSDNVN